MKFRTLVAGFVGAFIISSSAMAADPIIIPPPAPPPPMAVAPAGYDWSGLYFGASAVPVNGGGTALVGGQVGFNLAPGNLVFGIDAVVFAVLAGGGGGCCVGIVSGKVGVTLGAADRVLAYGTVGRTFVFGGLVGVGVTLAGGGVEFGIRENFSAFVEALFPLSGGAGLPAVRIGVNFRLGN